MDLEQIVQRKMSDNNGGKGDKVVVVYQSLITQFELIRMHRSSSQQVVEFKGPGSQESDTRRLGASTIQLEIPSRGVSIDTRTGVSTSVSRSARTGVTPMGFGYAHSGNVLVPVQGLCQGLCLRVGVCQEEGLPGRERIQVL